MQIQTQEVKQLNSKRNSTWQTSFKDNKSLFEQETMVLSFYTIVSVIYLTVFDTIYSNLPTFLLEMTVPFVNVCNYALEGPGVWISI